MCSSANMICWNKVSRKSNRTSVGFVSTVRLTLASINYLSQGLTPEVVPDAQVQDLTNSTSQLTVDSKPVDGKGQEKKVENKESADGKPVDEPLPLKRTRQQGSEKAKESDTAGLGLAMLTRSQAKLLGQVSDSGKGKAKQKEAKIVVAPGKSTRLVKKSTGRSRRQPKSKKRVDLEEEEEDEGEDEDYKKAPEKVNIIIDLTGDVSDSRRCMSFVKTEYFDRIMGNPIYSAVRRPWFASCC
jgi:hypothetical protein